MRLVEYANQWHKLWSVRFALIAAFLAGVAAAYAVLPTDWLPAIPDWVKASLALGSMLCGGCSAAARVVQQSSVTGVK